MLRANALGNINPASGFTVFLRNGMSVWMRTVEDQGNARGKIRQQAPSVFTEPDMDLPGAGLASILADVILNTDRPARN